MPKFKRKLRKSKLFSASQFSSKSKASQLRRMSTSRSVNASRRKSSTMNAWNRARRRSWGSTSRFRFLRVRARLPTLTCSSYLGRSSWRTRKSATEVSHAMTRWWLEEILGRSIGTPRTWSIVQSSKSERTPKKNKRGPIYSTLTSSGVSFRGLLRCKLSVWCFCGKTWTIRSKKCCSILSATIFERGQ